MITLKKKVAIPSRFDPYRGFQGNPFHVTLQLPTGYGHSLFQTGETLLLRVSPESLPDMANLRQESGQPSKRYFVLTELPVVHMGLQFKGELLSLEEAYDCQFDSLKGRHPFTYTFAPLPLGLSAPPPLTEDPAPVRPAPIPEYPTKTSYADIAAKLQYSIAANVILGGLSFFTLGLVTVETQEISQSSQKPTKGQIAALTAKAAVPAVAGITSSFITRKIYRQMIATKADADAKYELDMFKYRQAEREHYRYQSDVQKHSQRTSLQTLQQQRFSNARTLYLLGLQQPNRPVAGLPTIYEISSAGGQLKLTPLQSAEELKKLYLTKMDTGTPLS